MAGSSYVPGSWLGILRAHTAVLLGPDTPPAMAGALWDLLGSKPAVHEVLHAVTSSSGGSLTQIPSFGILDFAGPLRVFLRGDLELAVELPDGRVELDGRDVTTWNERRFALPGACRVTIPAAGPGGRPELPLGEGVVLLQSLALALAPGQSELAPAPVSSPAAVVVDSAGVADVPDSPPDADGLAETIAPDHGASAETVVGVLDDDAPAEDDRMYGEEAGSGKDSGPWVESAPADALPAGSTTLVSDQTSSYDHLWERTVVRSIEDAAVRDDADADAADAGLDADAGTPAAAPAFQEQGAPPVPKPAEGDVKEPTAAPPGAVEHTPAVGHTPAGVLIDSVPWKKGPSATAAAANVAPEPAPAPKPAPVPAQAPFLVAAPASAPESVAFDNDHDGQTVMKSSTGALAGQSVPAAVEDPQAGPTVLARVCGQGHANPPTRAQCAACGAGLVPDAVQVPRPRLGRVRVSTGELLDLDQSLVIGRQPSVSRVQGGVMPRLVQVPSPEGDISRSHVEVRLEGWHVLLCDLKATNGTVLVREGQPPRRLAQNEMAILLDGDIAELGDNISLRFEEIP